MKRYFPFYYSSVMTLSTKILSLFTNTPKSELITSSSNSVWHWCKKINDLEPYIPLNHSRFSILLYANDLVFLAIKELNLQTMVNKLKELYNIWKVLMNIHKWKNAFTSKEEKHREVTLYLELEISSQKLLK